MAELLTPNRRSFLFGLVGAFAAPAIVRATSLMRIIPIGPPIIELFPGMLLCNGAVLSRKDHQKLFEALETAWDGRLSLPGTDKFSLPKLDFDNVRPVIFTGHGDDIVPTGCISYVPCEAKYLHGYFGSQSK